MLSSNNYFRFATSVILVRSTLSRPFGFFAYFARFLKTCPQPKDGFAPKSSVMTTILFGKKRHPDKWHLIAFQRLHRVSTTNCLRRFSRDSRRKCLIELVYLSVLAKRVNDVTHQKNCNLWNEVHIAAGNFVGCQKAADLLISFSLFNKNCLLRFGLFPAAILVRFSFSSGWQSKCDFDCGFRDLSWN